MSFKTQTCPGCFSSYEYYQHRSIVPPCPRCGTGGGFGLNAGTPVGDEACQIGGLREQLKRLDAALSAQGGAA